MRNVTFPNFGIDININPIAFSVGSIHVHWYAIIIVVGLLLAMFYCFKRAKFFGVDLDRLIDVVIGGLIGGITGARLYYVAFSWEDYAEEPWRIFYVWEGGLAIYGGLIGAILVGWLVARWRKLNFKPVLDIAALGFLIGQGIGRWGNFVNVEAFGGNTDLPWGMSGTVITNYLTNHQTELEQIGMIIDPSMPVHPTFLYESLWCLLGFVILHFYSKRRKFDGEIFLLYSAWYGLGRFVIEGLRTDSLMIGYIRVSQLLAGIIVVVSLAIWLLVLSKIRREDDPEYLKLYVNTEEAQDILENGYHPVKKKKVKKSEERIESDSQYSTISVDDEIEETDSLAELENSDEAEKDSSAMETEEESSVEDSQEDKKNG